MRPSLALHTHRDAIRAIALSHRVASVRVFGSVLHGDDVEGSDLNLLVEPTADKVGFSGVIPVGCRFAPNPPYARPTPHIECPVCNTVR